MPQSEEDFIKKSKYITDRILVRDFFQWESFFSSPFKNNDNDNNHNNNKNPHLNILERNSTRCQGIRDKGPIRDK